MSSPIGDVEHLRKHPTRKTRCQRLQGFGTARTGYDAIAGLQKAQGNGVAEAHAGTGYKNGIHGHSSEGY